MTLKEAILRTLDEINSTANHMAVMNHINKNGYYDFSKSKTPWDTVSATLGDFIRKGDTRVKRIPKPGGTYIYYLAKNENEIGINHLDGSINTVSEANASSESVKPYHERSLHKLLSSFLKNEGIYSKTIFHEKSTSNKSTNQVWSHPDVVGIRLFKLKSPAGQSLIKSINKTETFELSSYEIKKEITTDTELKQAFFQAVSNSSWANHGYLVAFDFNDSLMDEMERLNKSFGIGIIKLHGNPFRSKFLFHSKHRSLDFKTIDKLCLVNTDFERFIAQAGRIMNAQEDYYMATQKELESFCDTYFTGDNDVQFEEYCSEQRIPFEKDPEIEIKSV